MADHANNEWISIGDLWLLWGVLVLFFVIAILLLLIKQQLNRN